jgi:hypothetical protein
MDLSALLARARVLRSRARTAHDAARALRATTLNQRHLIAEAVRRQPARRLARSARGGSENRLEGLPETPDRRCPVCRSDEVKALGYVQAVDGVLKSEHVCEACERRFVLLRTSPTFLRADAADSES